MRGEAKVTLPQAYSISLPCDTMHEHTLFLHECFFDFVFLFVCNGWQSEQCVCIKFCVKLGKSASGTLEMLHEAFGEHSSSRTAVTEWHSCFKASRVSTEDDEHSG
jgi:hypothetical protein